MVLDNMSPTDVANWLIEVSGCYLSGRVALRSKMVIVLLALIIVDSLVLMKVRWDDVKLRFFTFEDVLINAYILFVYICFAINPAETAKLMAIVERRMFDVQYQMTDSQKKILNHSRRSKEMTMKILLLTVLIYHSCNCFLPGILGTYQIARTPPGTFYENTIEELPLAFESLYPFRFMRDSLVPYYSLVLVQSVCAIGEAIVFGAWSLLAITAYMTVETELEVLIQRIRDTDFILESHVNQLPSHSHQYSAKQLVQVEAIRNDKWNKDASGKANTDRDNEQWHRENSRKQYGSHSHGASTDTLLKWHLQDIVTHHQSIISVVKDVHKTTNFLTFMLNQIVCCQVCVSLYSSFVLESTILKFRSFVTVFSVLGNFGLFCLFGQSLINKSDKLKLELMASSWLEKPLWYKRSLYFIMIRCTTPLQIKPLGLYILNMQNFCMVLNASYSYYNFLRKLKKE